jgi:hypothetical protein
MPITIKQYYNVVKLDHKQVDLIPLLGSKPELRGII